MLCSPSRSEGCAVFPVPGSLGAPRSPGRTWAPFDSPDPDIAAMVAEVDWTGVSAKIQWLVDFGTRYSYASNHFTVADAIGDVLRGLRFGPRAAFVRVQHPHHVERGGDAARNRVPRLLRRDLRPLRLHERAGRVRRARRRRQRLRRRGGPDRGGDPHAARFRVFDPLHLLCRRGAGSSRKRRPTPRGRPRRTSGSSGCSTST